MWLVVWLPVCLLGAIFAFWGKKPFQVLIQSQAGVGSPLLYLEKGSEINMKQAVLGHLFSPALPYQQ